jgi:hypothetical protein
MVISGLPPVNLIRPLGESFRDPSGFLYHRGEILLRQVNSGYREDYECLMTSGLYDRLTQAQLLVAHEEVSVEQAATNDAYKVLRPELIPFISYPYEWSFSQLQDAALLTLRIQKESLGFGMSLKDCSAYNVQFRDGRPIFIDILSFEKYQEGRPWIAYRQFCQHFLAPLALMAYTDARLNQLSRVHIDGVPLDLASSLLPSRTFARFALLFHIHLHAKSQRHFAKRKAQPTRRRVSRHAALGLVDNLKTAMQRMKWQPLSSEWSDYYAATNYSTEAFLSKKQLVTQILKKIAPRPSIVWDLGSNTGEFSRMASEMGIQTISFDGDPACVEKNYLECRNRGETHLLPLLLDLTNPSSGGGWENRERRSLLERGPADTVLALALIHHLAIANNLPLSKIAAFFGRICHSLVIEFVPKTDSQAARLLASREDIFQNYDQMNFEQEFSRLFKINFSANIPGTQRTIYWMEKIIE